MIGVTFMGSLMSTVYTLKLMLPDSLTIDDAVYDSLDEALIVAEKLPNDMASLVISQANLAFDNAFFVVLTATAIITALSLVVLPYCLHNSVRTKIA